MVNIIVDTLHDWDIIYRIQSLSFGTTSRNTGNINGACKLIEDKIDRKLLYLACHHHVSEIILYYITLCLFLTLFKNN